MVGGKVVYASGEFSKLAPPPLPVSPDWSPIKHYGGYQQPQEIDRRHRRPRRTVENRARNRVWGLTISIAGFLGEAGMWSLGCDCFAF